MNTRFVETGRARSKTITLEWPIDIEGRGTVSAVIVQRLTVGEIADWQSGLKDKPDDARVRLPMIRYEDGTIIPDEIIDRMDDDDKDRIDEESEPFLPRRFRASPEGGSTRGTGDPTGPSSGE